MSWAEIWFLFINDIHHRICNFQTEFLDNKLDFYRNSYHLFVVWEKKKLTAEIGCK